MLDEQKLRQLQQQLSAKIDDAEKFYQNYVEEQERYGLSAEEIERQKQEMEK